MDKKVEDPSTKELNTFVQNMLKQMQDRFEEMSGNIVGRVDEMGKILSYLFRQTDRRHRKVHQ